VKEEGGGKGEGGEQSARLHSSTIQKLGRKMGEKKKKKRSGKGEKFQKNREKKKMRAVRSISHQRKKSAGKTRDRGEGERAAITFLCIY